MADQHPGSRARYLKGCRCPACSAAHYRYSIRRQRAIVRGDWQPWTDAGPAREHARVLRRAGLTVTNIARLAGVHQGSVYRLLGENGCRPSRRLRPDTAAAILAVRPDLAVPRGTVDATGTRRRVRALVALGWTQTQLAGQLGMQPVNLSAMLRAVRGQDTVRATTAVAVRGLYDRLWNKFPAEDTPRAARNAAAARRMARERGWPPPLAWNDDRIDDPSAKPRGWKWDAA